MRKRKQIKYHLRAKRDVVLSMAQKSNIFQEPLLEPELEVQIALKLAIELESNAKY